MVDHEEALDHIRACTSLAELGELQVALERRTAELTAATEAPAAKRARAGAPTPAAVGEDIQALARVPVSKADVAGKSEIRVLLNVSRVA